MDQQSERVGLGVGRAGPVDQEQGDGAGELRTLTGVLSGQGFGGVLREGYVCQEIILLPERPPMLSKARGSFYFVPKVARVTRGELGQIPTRERVFPHLEIQG